MDTYTNLALGGSKKPQNTLTLYMNAPLNLNMYTYTIGLKSLPHVLYRISVNDSFWSYIYCKKLVRKLDNDADESSFQMQLWKDLKKKKD